LHTVRLGNHPTDILWRDRTGGDEDDAGANWRARLFVAAANTNNVYSVGVSSSGDLRAIETINVASTPMHPLGMTPSALAMSPDQKRLYVVCSDANALAVADITEGRTHVLGFVPTGWYPTAVKALSDGQVIVLNGKGSRSYPNPNGPNPTVRRAPVSGGNAAVQYVALIQTGSASVIPPITDDQLDDYTTRIDSSRYSACPLHR
jgi:DNA-binding beta-propeller fold protein YncE